MNALNASLSRHYRDGIAGSKCELGYLCATSGDYGLAFKYLNEARELYDQHGMFDKVNERGRSNVFTHLSILHKNLRQYETAREYIYKSIHIDSALAACNSAYAQQDLLTDYVDLSEIYRGEKKYDEALNALGVAEAIARKLNDDVRAAILMNNRANIYCEDNKMNQARAYYEQSAVYLVDKDKEAYCESVLGLGRCYQHNDFIKSNMYAQMSLDTAISLGNKVAAGNALRLLVAIYEDTCMKSIQAEVGIVRPAIGYMLQTIKYYDAINDKAAEVDFEIKNLESREQAEKAQDREKEKIATGILVILAVFTVGIVVIFAMIFANSYFLYNFVRKYKYIVDVVVFVFDFLLFKLFGFFLDVYVFKNVFKIAPVSYWVQFLAQLLIACSIAYFHKKVINKKIDEVTERIMPVK